MSKERESGTLKLLMAQNLPASRYLWGKIGSIFLVAVLLLLPVLLGAFLLVSNIASLGSDVFKTSALLATYLVYYFITAGVTVLVSAFSRKSKQALFSRLHWYGYIGSQHIYFAQTHPTLRWHRHL